MATSNQLASSSAQMSEQYGVEKPISIAGPLEFDLNRSIELEKVGFFTMISMLFFQHFFILYNNGFFFSPQFLVDSGLYENPEEEVKREEVLGEINQVNYNVFIFLSHN